MINGDNFLEKLYLITPLASRADEPLTNHLVEGFFYYVEVLC